VKVASGFAPVALPDVSIAPIEPRRPDALAKDDEVMGWLSSLNIFSRASFVLPASRRLDGRNRALLAASFRPLRDGERGWITTQEARKLFSPVEDDDVLGEMDTLGIANLAAFASALGNAQFKFAPAGGRLYLTSAMQGTAVSPQREYLEGASARSARKSGTG
jgi:hypothetical protein